jgi:hypothetical protein
MRMATERIGDILLEMKACTPQELQAGLQTQAIFGGRIGTNLLELGIIDEAQLAAALTKAYGVPCLAGAIEPDLNALAAVDAELVERLGIVPLQMDNRRLRVVVADPRNLSSLDELSFATGKTIEPVLAAESRVWELMHRCYGIDKHLRGLAVQDDLQAEATTRGGQIGAGTMPGEDTATAPRVLPMREALDLIEQVSDPVVLSAVLVRGAGGRVGRAVFLKCQGSRAVAWLAAGPLLSNDVRGVEIPLEREGPFGAAAELRAPVLVPVRSTHGATPFYAGLGGAAPMNVFVAPVILRGRAVALLYADGGPGATLHEEAADLITLTATLNRRFQVLAPVSSMSS